MKLLSYLLAGLLLVSSVCQADDSEPENRKSYLLGPGDIIRVSVYNHPELETQAAIAPDGSLNFPLLGSVFLQGLTFAQAEQVLTSELVSRGYISNSQVNILIIEYRSQRVSVLGEVRNPGRYPLDSHSTLIDMLAQAGGMTGQGGDSIVFIRNGERREFFLNELVQSDASNIELQANDQIFVPREEQVYVYGQVARPGSYRLEPHMSVIQALTLAGGFTRIADEDDLYVQRRDKEGNMVSRKIGLTDSIQPGDVIFVEESLF